MKKRLIFALLGAMIFLSACEGGERVTDRGVEYVGAVERGSGGYQLIFTDERGKTYDYYVGSLNWLPELTKGEIYDVQTYQPPLEVDYRVENIFKYEE